MSSASRSLTKVAQLQRKLTKMKADINSEVKRMSNYVEDVKKLEKQIKELRRERAAAGVSTLTSKKLFPGASCASKEHERQQSRQLRVLEHRMNSKLRSIGTLDTEAAQLREKVRFYGDLGVLSIKKRRIRDGLGLVRVVRSDMTCDRRSPRSY